MTATLFGAVKQPDNPEAGNIQQWKFVYTANEILDAALDDIVLGEKRETVVEELEKLYPTPNEMLTHVYWSQGDPRKITVYVDQYVLSENLRLPTTCNYDKFFERLLNLVKTYGPVRIQTNHWTICEETNKYATRLPGCLMDSDVLRYDAVLARTKSKAKKRRQRTPINVRVSDINHVTRNLLMIYNGKTTGMKCSCNYSGQTRAGVVYELWRMLQQFDLLFGQNAHRKVTAFRDLCKKWAADKARCERAFIASYVTAEFCDWMSNESTVKFGKTKGVFKPRACLRLKQPKKTSEKEQQ